MSMTREEASKWFKKNIRSVTMPGAHAAHQAAIAALRPVSQEQVEKVWGECSYCKGGIYNSFAYDLEVRGADGGIFCKHCGRPMTDNAADIVMERLEELRE